MESSPQIHDPRGERTHTVIFLHGRDSNAYEFAQELFESEISIDKAVPERDRTLPALFPTVRWVFPSAPLLHSERFDTPMSQWFDMWAVEDPEKKSGLQAKGLQESIRFLLKMIEKEEKLLPRNKIFLCGISQGFATALALFLGEGRGGFAGLIGLCSWLPFSSQVEEAIRENKNHLPLYSSLKELYYPESKEPLIKSEPTVAGLRATPLFLGHALDDNVVPLANGQRMKNDLSELGLHVEWNIYEDGGHWISEPEGMDDIVAFMSANLH